MSGRQPFGSREHARACELAAGRIDEVLAPNDEAWLADHLEACPSCAAVAAEYDAQHGMLVSLRSVTPTPPRDLWARTSAAISAERPRTRGRLGWRRLRGSPRRPSPSSTPLALLPVMAMVAVVVVVGAGLLTGGRMFPGGGVVSATPITIDGAADLQVLAVDSAGNLQLLSRRVDQVCPTGVADCGASPTFSVAAVSSLGSTADIYGAMSPSGGQMVVVSRGVGNQGVYVVAVRATASPSPSTTSATAPSQTIRPSATATHTTHSLRPDSSHPSPTPAHASSSATAGTSPATHLPTATPSPVVPSSAPPASPSEGTVSPTAPSASPSSATSSLDTAPPSPGGSGSPVVPSGSAGPTPSVAVSQSVSPDATSPGASPSGESAPAPQAAIQIASDVSVVGVPTYSPDGTRLAFAAMPADGSTGPDIYVWAVGDASAKAITADHDSWLAGWTDAGILVSRVDDGVPATYTLDPLSGAATPIGAADTWLPSVSPTGSTAAWWSGTVKLAPDGVTWLPDQGQLVLGEWPDSDAPSEAPQVLASGPLNAWQVRWDAAGAAMALWVATGADGSGQLSLYGIDAASGLPNLSAPMLAPVAANADFSLRSGRLAWTAPPQGGAQPSQGGAQPSQGTPPPSQGGPQPSQGTPQASQAAPQVVNVLAWSGSTVYPPITVAADGKGTVIP